MDPNVKKISRVGGFWTLVGLGFLAVGLLILFVCLASPLPPPGCATGNVTIFGGVLALLGAIFMCVRFGVIVDRLRRTVTTWWGLLVPFYRTVHPFTPSHHVTLSREERSAGRSSYEVFPVRLEGAGTDAITIHEPRDHDKARHLAEEVANFVHLGIRDRSSGEEVAREAGALDQSLQQRVKRSGRSVPLPAQPPSARSIFSYGGTRAPTTIDIPPVGRSVRWFLLVMFIAGFITIFTELGMWLDGHQAELDIGIRAVLVFLFILGCFLPLLLRTAILRERVVVSLDELVVTRRDIFGTKTTRLMSSEIEEVVMTRARYGIYRGYGTFVGGTSRVVIRSDRGSIELGAAFSTEEEVRWLRDVLIHVLTAGESAK
jgi:hypothetical protein